MIKVTQVHDDKDCPFRGTGNTIKGRHLGVSLKDLPYRTVEITSAEIERLVDQTKKKPLAPRRSSRSAR